MVAFVGLIGVWIYSMLPLLGSFKRTIGNLGMSKPPIAIINSQQDHNPAPILQSPVQATPTLQPTPTIIATVTWESTPVAPTGGPTDLEFLQLTIQATMARPAQAPLPTITYDLDRDVYDRSNQLRLKYADTPVIETYPGKYSYYWPPLGGSNCDTQNGVLECEYMASGYKVADYVGIGWACDAKIPLGYIIEVVELNIWGECTDRGYTIKQDKDGLYWFDQLIGYPMTNWEAPITVRTYAP